MCKPNLSLGCAMIMSYLYTIIKITAFMFMPIYSSIYPLVLGLSHKHKENYFDKINDIGIIIGMIPCYIYSLSVIIFAPVLNINATNLSNNKYNDYIVMALKNEKKYHIISLPIIVRKIAISEILLAIWMSSPITQIMCSIIIVSIMTFDYELGGAVHLGLLILSPLLIYIAAIMIYIIKLLIKYIVLAFYTNENNNEHEYAHIDNTDIYQDNHTDVNNINNITTNNVDKINLDFDDKFGFR